MAQPDFRERFQTLGLVIQAPRGQAETDRYVAEDRERLGRGDPSEPDQAGLSTPGRLRDAGKWGIARVPGNP